MAELILKCSRKTKSRQTAWVSGTPLSAPWCARRTTPTGRPMKPGSPKATKATSGTRKKWLYSRAGEVVNTRTRDFLITLSMSASGSLAGQGVGHEDKHHAGDQLEGRVGKNHPHDQPCQLLCRKEHPDHHHGLRPAGVLPELAAAAPGARNADSRRQCRAPEGRTVTQRGNACPRGDPAVDHRRAGRRVGAAVAGDAGQGALHPHSCGAIGDRHP